MQCFKKLPKIRVKNRVASRDIKIRDSFKSFAEAQAVFKNFVKIFAAHALRRVDVFARINVTMFAPLIAFVRYVPLERKISHGINTTPS